LATKHKHFLRRLTTAEFERVADATRMLDLARDIARAYFVDGCSLTEIAMQYQTSKQRVQKAVRSVETAYVRMADPTIGVFEVSLSFPARLALELGVLSEAIDHCPDRTAKAVDIAIDGIRKAVKILT